MREVEIIFSTNDRLRFMRAIISGALIGMFAFFAFLGFEAFLLIVQKQFSLDINASVLIITLVATTTVSIILSFLLTERRLCTDAH